jgi:hypothetical protein
MTKNGFTKFELIAVIFLVAVAIVFDILFILYLNQKSRDIAVLSDIKQIQSGLDIYLIKNSHYPEALAPISLNDIYANSQKLCAEGFMKTEAKCSQTIFNPVPNSDLAAGNIFIYQSAGAQEYKIEFNLKTNLKAQGLSRGKNCATNNQILSQPCF